MARGVPQTQSRHKADTKQAQSRHKADTAARKIRARAEIVVEAGAFDEGGQQRLDRAGETTEKGVMQIHKQS